MIRKVFIIFTIMFLAINANAAPTYKNCGTPAQSSFCTNGSCRTDFDTTTVVTNCEMDFSTAMTPGGHMSCTVDNEAKIAWTMAADGSHINFMPKPPLVSLAGLSVYHICKVATITDR